MELSRFAFARPHVLLIEAPGGTGARLALERVLRERGWPLVDSPADADILAVAGAGIEAFADRVWGQLPGPRARFALTDPGRVGGALDQAAQWLRDLGRQREDAVSRLPPLLNASDVGMPEHTDMGMEMPAGLEMADRAPDRDGLQLDVLHVPWGPALPWWPAGLVVRSCMQGDVLADVEVSRVGGETPAAAFWLAAAESIGSARAGAAARLDALTRLLAVAGWEAERLRAQRVRDDLLTAEPSARTRDALRRLHRRVGRSRTLARMSSRMGRYGGADVAAQYRQWLADADASVADGAETPATAPADDIMDLLTESLTGAELSAARLVVASLDPWLSGALVTGAQRV